MTEEQRERRTVERIRVVEGRRAHRALYQRELRELAWLYTRLDAIREYQRSLGLGE